ncbi:hypothetical protein Prum_057530 [Phytohabitans rumicis]|uniref:Uncharacterized protein n=1 Tax=Phytohabitans rumicis TaxID=1076125 RepID=A0A6V8LBG3_9ACTN|nr:hypothetical protein Prum_057530 [Phytohabitans rumicis]
MLPLYVEPDPSVSPTPSNRLIEVDPGIGVAALQSADLSADPTTAWTLGQHVVLADGTRAYWDGDHWRDGEAP